MRKTVRRLAPLTLAAAGAVAVLAAPVAGAQPNCVNTGQTAFGGSTTVCQSPGNAQITTSPGQINTTYLYPYGDAYYGPALVVDWP
ncbi:hypothetical protein E4P42_02995 [Mycobacterium sp. PS03-16]|uniref:hypothetical protein n=1 Tax=Mycobacterium sp. PS03-16 TaxID=2559611 RepID=UPI00107427CE|nr:hypothetical protein [Mycobacterium sp. PS03-16]TFV61152.1 hypothetical protein E4P42_02995 [Mycobacterium sp. PS03-16]